MSSLKPLVETKFNAASFTLVVSRVAFALFGLSNVLKHDQLLSTPLSSYLQRQSLRLSLQQNCH